MCQYKDYWLFHSFSLRLCFSLSLLACLNANGWYWSVGPGLWEVASKSCLVLNIKCIKTHSYITQHWSEYLDGNWGGAGTLDTFGHSWLLGKRLEGLYCGLAVSDQIRVSHSHWFTLLNILTGFIYFRWLHILCHCYSVPHGKITRDVQRARAEPNTEVVHSSATERLPRAAQQTCGYVLLVLGGCNVTGKSRSSFMFLRFQSFFKPPQWKCL